MAFLRKQKEDFKLNIVFTRRFFKFALEPINLAVGENFGANIPQFIDLLRFNFIFHFLNFSAH